VTGRISCGGGYGAKRHAIQCVVGVVCPAAAVRENLHDTLVPGWSLSGTLLTGCRRTYRVAGKSRRIGVVRRQRPARLLASQYLSVAATECQRPFSKYGHASAGQTTVVPRRRRGSDRNRPPAIRVEMMIPAVRISEELWTLTGTSPYDSWHEHDSFP
jgi:hypothetical protein